MEKIMMPHVFIGTLYVNEGDFEQCSSMIKRQTNCSIEHQVISGLRERDAHNALWHSWNERKSNFDLFVKVDADTILASEHTISDIWQVFSSNPRITGVQSPLYDYMTMTLINGLNAFSPRVVFNESIDNLFCDRVDTGHDICIKSWGVPQQLIPAGYHCYHASPVQAFHFGLHRALKGQRHIIESVYNVWLRQGKDNVRGYALLGALKAKELLNSSNCCYSDEQFIHAFSDATGRYDELLSSFRI
jgi:hypothetical protein